MTSEEIRFLLSEEGEATVQEASRHADTLSALEHLRQRHPPDLASAAVRTAELRKRGKSKFTRADRMLFTREGLEMATGERVARWRARRFAPYERIADLTCGIGGDAIFLAQHAPVIAQDLVPSLLEMARHNASVYDAGDRFFPVCADSTRWRPDAPALFIDPARRSEGKKLRRGEDLLPPLPQAVEWAEGAKAAAIKLSPAFPWETYADRAEVELISEGGECREAVLWFREARTCSIRASLVDREVTMESRPTEEIAVRPPGSVLYEPDAAVRRAHLIDPLAEEIGAWKLDPEIAYLSSDRYVPTPFATAYEIEETFPFRLKDLQKRLREKGAGKAIIKKRGVAYDPAEIERRLKLDGDRTVIVALTRLQGKPTALLLNPLPSSEEKPPLLANPSL